MNSGTNPYIISNSYRTGITSAHDTFLRVERMICRVQPYSWTKQHIIAYRNMIPVQHDTIKISEEIIPDTYIKSKFTPEVGFKVNTIADMFQQFSQ